MKKIIALTTVLIFLCSFLLPLSIQASSGDIVGTIYATDIKTCINGVWVDSYNIGGRTVVIIEDITSQYSYYDSARSLVLNNLNPDYLISGEHSYEQTPGTPVGNIYETDVKTFFRGKEMTAFSLNGKMAVIVEELGGDNAYSDIGGSYRWDPEERTLTLNSVYGYPYEMRKLLEDNHWNIMLTEIDGGLNAQPVSAPFAGGYIHCEVEIPNDSMIPVFYKNELIGYQCRFPNMSFSEGENHLVSNKEQPLVTHFFVDKVTEMVLQQEPVQITYLDWLNYLETHTLMTVKDKFETDNYVFLYAYFAHTHGGTQALIKLNKADGTRIDYDDEFASVSLHGQKSFENVIIDRDKETVSLHYDYDYLIDLKTDEVKLLNSSN